MRAKKPFLRPLIYLKISDGLRNRKIPKTVIKIARANKSNALTVQFESVENRIVAFWKAYSSSDARQIAFRQLVYAFNFFEQVVLVTRRFRVDHLNLFLNIYKQLLFSSPSSM